MNGVKMLKRTMYGHAGFTSCARASSTPHDETTARKVREDPVLRKNQQLDAILDQVVAGIAS